MRSGQSFTIGIILDCYITRVLGCFICSMESGIQVYNVEPLTQKGRIGEGFLGFIHMAAGW